VSVRFDIHIGIVQTVWYSAYGKTKDHPDNRILLTLTPEVSSLDFANAVRQADFVIPALEGAKSDHGDACGERRDTGTGRTAVE
jgi:hypothetical protein